MTGNSSKLRRITIPFLLFVIISCILITPALGYELNSSVDTTSPSSILGWYSSLRYITLPNIDTVESDIAYIDFYPYSVGGSGGIFSGFDMSGTVTGNINIGASVVGDYRATWTSPSTYIWNTTKMHIEICNLSTAYSGSQRLDFIWPATLSIYNERWTTSGSCNNAMQSSTGPRIIAGRTEIWTGEPEPEYEADLSASGTFCYAETISFNASITPIPEDPVLYDIDFYKEGIPDFVDADYNDDGYYTFSYSLEPGYWSVKNTANLDSNEYTSPWVNFTIVSNCSQAFNGTFTTIYVPWSGNYTWGWDPESTWTYFDWNGTEFVDEDYLNMLIDMGIINETEADNIINITIYNQQIEADKQNATNSDIVQILIDLNESVGYGRSNLESSKGILNQSVVPVIPILSSAISIFPSSVINLISAVLAIEFVLILIMRKKE